jgi:hypothetical protein
MNNCGHVTYQIRYQGAFGAEWLLFLKTKCLN